MRVKVARIYAERVIVYLPRPVREDLERRLVEMGLRLSDYVRSLILGDLRPLKK